MATVNITAIRESAVNGHKPGKHTPAYTHLRTHTRQVEADNRQLIAANEDLVCELARHIIRGCQAETRAAELEARVREHAAIVQRIDAQHAATIRDLEQHIANLEHRLHIRHLAEAAAAETQPMSTDEIRRHCTPSTPVITLQQAHGIRPVTNPGSIR